MKIKRFQVHHIRLPLKNPWVTAYGVEDSVESVLIKCLSENHEAWVETCPLTTPLYSPETAGSVFQMITQFFGKLVIGKDLEEKNSIYEILKPYRGNSFAKAGVEQCWWALRSLEKGVPLRRLFDGQDRDIPVGVGIGIKPSLDSLIEAVNESIKRGTQRVKLKIKKGWDLVVIREVRRQFPSLRLQVDCNGTYSLDDLKLFKEIDEFGLDMIEQPLYFRDLSDHATLQKEIRTPICLDESITTIRDAEQVIRLGSCKIICIKIGRVGGIFEALQIHDLAEKHGIECWVGSMMESSLGAAINVELSTLSNCKYPNEITTDGKFHTENLTDPPIKFSKPGFVSPSEGTYLNRSINEAFVERLTVAKATLD